MNVSTQSAELFGTCLAGFQARDPHFDQQFHKLLRPYLVNLVRKLARDLSDDLQEEVVQQTCLDLIGNSTTKFDLRRGSAKAFLFFAVCNALRTVRANYCPPGSPTRPRKSDDEYERANSAVSIEELGYELGTGSAERQITARCDANSLLEKAPPRVAVALTRIHYIGDTLNEVASDLSLSRFKLSRVISAYFLGVQNVHSGVVTVYRFVC
jgi:DNA-directed RNA polymerase specialized sigma24 family protein